MRQSDWKHRVAVALAVAAMAIGSANADTVHPDDVIIGDGVLCVGEDCMVDEPLGYLDRIQIQASVARLLFDDASTGVNIPSNDWRLVANDRAAYGRNIFIIEDVTNNTEPFAVEAGAATASLYVEGSNGDVGLGTASPAVELHILDMDSPTIRLEQFGGFPPAQTWDIVANEFNFMLRDKTHSFALPFRLETGAPTNSFYLDESGYVGVGTDNPTGPLDISRNGVPFIRLTDTNTGVNWALQNNSSEFRITTPTGPGIEFAVTAQGEVEAHGPLTLSKDGPTWTALEDVSTGITWNYQNNGGEARITTAANPGIEFALAPNGNLTIQGEIFTAGSCSAGCDRVFEADYDLRSIREHAKLMWTNGYLPAVGPTAEEGSMNLSAKVGGMLNELEHAHIYIAELEEQVSDIPRLEAQVAGLGAELADQVQKNVGLEDRLASVEKQLAATRQ